MTLLLLYLSVALLLSFMCSILEAILLSTPVSYIKMKEREGSSSAKLFMNYKTNVDRPIAAILSINTVAHTIGAAGVGAEAVKLFGEAYFGLISAILTILILVLSEIIPKTIGACYWKQLSMSSAKWIKFLIIVSFPLVWLSEWITRLVAPKSKEKSISREELSAMVQVGKEEGLFGADEDVIINNTIKLSQLKGDDVMTPRPVCVTASANMTTGTFHKHEDMLKHSRIPVYTDHAENITGYVLRQQVFDCLANDQFEVTLESIKREILFFEQTTPLTHIFKKMLSQREQIAILIDEYGGFEGIIAIEDIIEAILGLEILDEKDTIDDMQQLARQKWAQRQEQYHISTNSSN